ncbi:hypothetical protein SERLADRAFT_462642, partial [Serpula lacrymans var. lacrymans S7.9]
MEVDGGTLDAADNDARLGLLSDCLGGGANENEGTDDDGPAGWLGAAVGPPVAGGNKFHFGFSPAPVEVGSGRFDDGVGRPLVTVLRPEVCLDTSAVLDVAPNEKGVEAAALFSETCAGLSAGFVKLILLTGVGAGAVNKGVGTAALAPNSGAVTLVGSSPAFFWGPDSFFCSCTLARIFAIASASRSCFSHFENRDERRVGLSPTPPKSAGVGRLYDEATRRPGTFCDCWKGLMRIPTLVAIDWRKGRRAIGLSFVDSQSKFLPVFEGESGTSPGVWGSTDTLGVSCQTSSCRSSA